jgi:hypothetical protein
MKKQFLLIGTAAIIAFSACNDASTDSTTTTDSAAANTTTSTTTGPTTGTEIANFSTRSFVDVKTNKPVKLKWDAERRYYTDESGNQPYFYYDHATKDTFDYWGRRLNDYLIYENNDYTVDESRWSTTNISGTTTGDTTTITTGTGDIKIKAGDTKIKAKDGKYKEKTDTSKVKVTDDKMKVKER